MNKTSRLRSASIAGNANSLIKVNLRRFSAGITLETPILDKLLNDSQTYALDNPIALNESEIIKDESSSHHNKQIEISIIKVEPLKYDEERDFTIEVSKPVITGTETPWQALGQLIIPFLIAGMGNVAAGVVLDTVQHWEAFKTIPQLVILIPALLGLKGNVEMTLASRLSTHANLGHMDDAADLKSMIISNMALVQCQASTVGLIAPIVAIGLSLLTKEGTSISSEHVLIIITSSVVTANIANLILGSIMCLIIYLSRKININPDNIATPIAASLGDFTTLILLAYISHMLFIFSSNPWLSKVLLIFLLLLIPLWVVIARRNYYTRPVLLNGWIPILGNYIMIVTVIHFIVLFLRCDVITKCWRFNYGKSFR